MNVGFDQSKLQIIDQRLRAIGMPRCNPNPESLPPKLPNDTATEKAGSAENRDNAIAHGCHVVLTLARATQLIKNPIDLARHDKIVLVQALDLFGSQRDGRVTPAEVDIRVMAFGFSQVAYVSNETKRLLKIAEAERPFDTEAVIAQFPIRRLRLKPLRFRMGKWRNTAATRSAFLLGEILDHILPSDDSLESKAFENKPVPCSLKLSFGGSEATLQGKVSALQAPSQGNQASCAA
jgi:hypothetical protein